MHCAAAALWYWFTPQEVGGDMEWTIVRPGGLKNEPGTGGGLLTESRSVCGAISREDVAELVVEALFSPNTVGKVPPGDPGHALPRLQISGAVLLSTRCGLWEGRPATWSPLGHVVVRVVR